MCSDNSAIGIWIRTKLHLAGGSLVTVKHLEQYGRTDFTLARIRDDIFVVDLIINMRSIATDGGRAIGKG